MCQFSGPNIRNRLGVQVPSGAAGAFGTQRHPHQHRRGEPMQQRRSAFKAAVTMTQVLEPSD